MLYQFEKLDRKLDEWGFPSMKGGSGFQIIKGIDFEEAYKSGSISFEDDGIYLEYEGKKYRGYMYIKEFYVSYNGGPEKFPKFHLKRCQVIQEFINSGRFKQRYGWSNSDVNDIIDVQSKKYFKDQNLDLCSFCRNEIIEEVETTQDFFETLDKTVLEETNIEVDIFGYAREWQKISKYYRTKQDFKCESCSIQITNPGDKRYLHTHHKNGDKTNNKESNLECLCILCHSYKDIRHEENFDKKRMLKEINAFVKTYRTDLTKINNPYLKRYDSEQFRSNTWQ